MPEYVAWTILALVGLVGLFMFVYMSGIDNGKKSQEGELHRLRTVVSAYQKEEASQARKRKVQAKMTNLANEKKS